MRRAATPATAMACSWQRHADHVGRRPLRLRRHRRDDAAARLWPQEARAAQRWSLRSSHREWLRRGMRRRLRRRAAEGPWAPPPHDGDLRCAGSPTHLTLPRPWYSAHPTQPVISKGRPNAFVYLHTWWHVWRCATNLPSAGVGLDTRCELVRLCLLVDTDCAEIRHLRHQAHALDKLQQHVARLHVATLQPAPRLDAMERRADILFLAKCKEILARLRREIWEELKNEATDGAAILVELEERERQS